MEKLQAAVKGKGMTVFAGIDHAAGAAEAGVALRPTGLLMFGHARGGTPLMQAVQTIGIDLPLKVLVWQDVAGDTWPSYNEPGWRAKRHRLGPNVAAPIGAMADALNAVAKHATGSPQRHERMLDAAGSGLRNVAWRRLF